MLSSERIAPSQTQMKSAPGSSMHAPVGGSPSTGPRFVPRITHCAATTQSPVCPALMISAVRARQEPPPPKIAAALILSSHAFFSKYPPPGAGQLPASVQVPGVPRRRARDSTRGSLFTASALVAREHELARLEAQLRAALDDQARVIFVVGDAGSGKTALLEEFTRRARAAYPELVAAIGNCNAYIGVGDPYLPFRQILEL